MQLSLPWVGSILSERYRLERVLGEGASSVVFAARDLRLDREVAVKVLKPQALMHAAEQRARFVSEARTLARLAHSHIVPVFDVGETAEGIAYLVLELVGDRSLATELEARGTLPLEEALGLLLPLMGALALAHDRGVVHRDLKPANVVLESRGTAGVRAKLLDFGIAKREGGTTSSGLALGTPGYMAPEQASSGTVGPASDVWAMGVLFFRCLTGRLPFEAPNATGMLLKVVHERAPRFSSVCPTLGRHITVALDQALEPGAAARPQSMRQFARNLAIACKQDGVRVPTDPDPVGLPEFAAWLSEADVEVTGHAGAVGETPPPSAMPRLVSVPPRRRPTCGRLLLALLAVLMSTSALVAMSGADDAAAVHEARAQQDPPASVGHPAPEQTTRPGSVAKQNFVVGEMSRPASTAPAFSMLLDLPPEATSGAPSTAQPAATPPSSPQSASTAEAMAPAASITHLATLPASSIHSASTTEARHRAASATQPAPLGALEATSPRKPALPHPVQPPFASKGRRASQSAKPADKKRIESGAQEANSPPTPAVPAPRPDLVKRWDW